MAEQSFPGSRRLLKSSEFDLVFKQCEYRQGNASLLILAKRNQQGFNRLGMVVSKRNIPHAVDRNRTKRLIREAFRKLVPKADTEAVVGLDFVVLPRKGALTDKDLGERIRQTFEKITNQDN